MSAGFSTKYVDRSLQTKTDGQTLMVIVLYVEDLLLTGNCQNLVAVIEQNIRPKDKILLWGDLYLSQESLRQIIMILDCINALDKQRMFFTLLS